MNHCNDNLYCLKESAKFTFFGGTLTNC